MDTLNTTCTFKSDLKYQIPNKPTMHHLIWGGLALRKALTNLGTWVRIRGTVSLTFFYLSPLVMRIHIAYASGIWTIYQFSLHWTFFQCFWISWSICMFWPHDMVLYIELHFSFNCIQAVFSLTLKFPEQHLVWYAHWVLKECVFCPFGARPAHVQFCGELELPHLSQTFNSCFWLLLSSLVLLFFCQNLLEQIISRKRNISSCSYLVIRNRKGWFYFLTNTSFS